MDIVLILAMNQKHATGMNANMAVRHTVQDVPVERDGAELAASMVSFKTFFFKII